jgi:hypothetical protein
LLDRAVGGLDRLRQAGQPVFDWTFGGGTALMIAAEHRVSKDIDVFITDPQYLAFLSPRLGGESIWSCETYDEAPHHLKLIFPEVKSISSSPLRSPICRRDVGRSTQARLE